MKTSQKRTLIPYFAALGTLVILLCAACAWMYLTFRTTERMETAETLLAESAQRARTERLLVALEEADILAAYHEASSAAEHAASMGAHDAAAFFRAIAEKTAAGDAVEALRTAVDSYRSTGEIPPLPNQADVSPATEERVPDAVSAYAAETAERCLAQFFGEGNSLRAERKNGHALIYTASNGYAVMNPKTGYPRAMAISLPPADKRLDAASCTAAALRFLEEMIPREAAAATMVREVTPDERAGSYQIRCISGGRLLFLTVRRDTGRVSRLVVRE